MFFMPVCLQVDPSGAYWAWKASAIGKNYLNANTFLEKRYNDELDVSGSMRVSGVSPTVGCVAVSRLSRARKHIVPSAQM